MMKQKKIPASVLITGIIVIGILEAIALFKGVNGILLTAVIGVIAGILGWSAPQLKTK